MEKYCENCGKKLEDDEEFCTDCGSKISKNTVICKNCGQIVPENVRFCNNCGHPTKEPGNFCQNCGNSLEPGQDFCDECGANLTKPLKESPIDKIKNDKKVLIAAITAIAVVLIGAFIFIGGMGDADIPLESASFGDVTMLVPEGSNFVETDSLPSYGIVGGYVVAQNAGDYSHDVFSIMFSTIEGGSDAPMEDVALDRVEGDIHIYKDRNGGDGNYITRQVGEYKIDVIGSNEDAIVKMLKSAEVTGTSQT